MLISHIVVLVPLQDTYDMTKATLSFTSVFVVCMYHTHVLPLAAVLRAGSAVD